MENSQLSSKNNLFTGNIYQNNDTWINIFDETKFLDKVLKMVVFQLFCPTAVYDRSLSYDSARNQTGFLSNYESLKFEIKTNICACS